jgi:hypothetical protein
VTGIFVRSGEDVDRLAEVIRTNARRLHAWISSQPDDPLHVLRRMKFEEVGVHPLEDRPLNVVEQINQSWTYSVALAAAKQLLTLHPEAGGFHLAPGAHASQDLDIMSEAPGLVGAETFAAVHPRNNNKLAADLAKLNRRPEVFRYIFFMSPRFPRNERHTALERHGVQVWSVEF